MNWCIDVAVQTPAHSALGDVLSYKSPVAVAPGALVRVPLGRREVLGVAWAVRSAGEDPGSEIELKPIAGVLDALPPLGDGWRDLVAFAARYYQRSLGEIALAALPPQLRDLSAVQLARRLKRQAPAACVGGEPAAAVVALTAEQTEALARFEAEPGPFLLFGSTGSGKTEVYLRSVATLLAREPAAQALVMVPEINLTPQLEARFKARFGADAVVSLHSGMTNPQRLASWLAAHGGAARIVLGTRMAVFASMPALRLIVVDEEHDPSYKQQEGARYSARDLAVWRGRREGAKVILGSATPSLESWHRSRPAEGEDAGGSYRRLAMPSRVGAGALPAVRLVDMNLQPPKTVLSGALLDAIGQRIARGEQSMVFLNRRGYAPVLACGDCGWKSECPHCSAFRVFHKIDRTLRCHHCGFTERVPRACPACGNPDIAPVGRGTERLEEHLGELFAPVRRPDGSAVRIARIDADSTRKQGALESQLAAVHAGEVDVLVGTQMIAKGHDFRRITLVSAINPDGALFSSDFRAPERLFGLLMQSAGRAGRDAAYLTAQQSSAEMWIQTHHPQHPLFAALLRHDYAAFAQGELSERAAAGMPPFAFQALLRADARTQEAAQAFLNAASAAAEALPGADRVTRYPAVPLTIQRVANVERAQMLIESGSRAALQKLLAGWQPLLHGLRRQPEGKGVIRWLVDVDPQAI
ncbi:replication restart helicase PriA [Variovorax ginsengisoli]|uniref:Replication restart protein PriA n=1 Tax=Variovorax ginsengisoli TaxID=363844 RepID=A0ABT8SAD8_9BURK|nr:primosomal protein N' [Variovorax ginsengisoli]MDN8616228.1 primosomal protein N' [Variovorax ginsengisoli]MDO1535398.1 primosomal protein N' [Variovorax ginsengisoli]